MNYLDLEAQGGGSDDESNDSLPSTQPYLERSDGVPEDEDPVEEKDEEVEIELQGITTTKEDAKFRLSAKAVFLTYAQLDNASKGLVISHLKKKLPTLKGYVIGEEKHVDGGTHYHVYLETTSKMNIVNCRFFDYKHHSGRICHPNIRAIKAKGHERVRWYCMKQGDYKVENIDLFPTPHNFTKKHGDLVAWTRYNQLKGAGEIKFPFILPDYTTTVHAPTSLDKKRHYWLWGPANLGKTKWVNDTFAGQKVFIHSGGQHVWEDYADEEVIVVDDMDVDHAWKEQLVACSNVWAVPVKRPGVQRFYNRFWKLNQARLIIILSNYHPGDLAETDWFKSRFNVIQLFPLPDVLPLVGAARPDVSERRVDSPRNLYRARHLAFAIDRSPDPSDVSIEEMEDEIIRRREARGKDQA